MRPRIAFGNPGTLIVLEELDQMRYSMNGSRRFAAGRIRPSADLWQVYCAS